MEKVPYNNQYVKEDRQRPIYGALSFLRFQIVRMVTGSGQEIYANKFGRKRNK